MVSNLILDCGLKSPKLKFKSLSLLTQETYWFQLQYGNNSNRVRLTNVLPLRAFVNK